MIVYRQLILFVIILTLLMNSSVSQIDIDATTGANSNDDSHGFDRGSDRSRYIVLILNRLGLGNRLGTISDWYQIAVASNRTLLVSWRTSIDCNIPFTTLFESGPEHVKILPFTFGTIKSVEEVATFHGLTYQSLDIDDTADNKRKWFAEVVAGTRIDDFVLSHEQVMSSTNIIITTYDGAISLYNTKCQHYLTMKSRFLSSLIPVVAVRNIVNNIKEKYFRNKIMIGVHVRVHDPMHDWSVVPPQGGGKDAMQFNESASNDDFRKVLQDIDDHFTYTTTTTSTTTSTTTTSVDKMHKFFISSNSGESKSFLISHFPDSVSLVLPNYNRSDVDGMWYGFIEWVLLSNCDLLINTYGSTFAVEAAQVHLRPIVSLWNKHLLFHHDMKLPYCGHMLFMRTYSNQGVTGSYREGTYDNRIIPVKSIKLFPCHHFDEYGLRDVYCTSSDDDQDRDI